MGHSIRRIAFAMTAVVLGLTFFLDGTMAAEGRQHVEELDTDRNGRPDEWRYYEEGSKDPSRIERDRDGDGKPEVKIFLEGGSPVRSEVDRNGDGKADLIRWISKGRPEREEADLNFDGRADAWVFYREGIKDLMIMDKNFDGQPDAWFYYDRTGMKLIGGRVDEDFDGKVDRSFGEVPEKEERRPWDSLLR
jgi:hypothetical protein